MSLGSLVLGTLWTILSVPVRFGPAVDSILEHSHNEDGHPTVDIFLEIGPHSALQGPLRQIQSIKSTQPVGYASLILRKENSIDTTLAAAGQLHSLGVKVDLNTVNNNADSERGKEGELKLLVDLPAYAWDHGTQFKGLSRFVQQYEDGVDHFGALLGERCPDLVDGERIWRRYIRPSDIEWLAEHAIDHVALFPATGYIVLALEAAQSFLQSDDTVDGFTLRDVGLHSPLSFRRLI